MKVSFRKRSSPIVLATVLLLVNLAVWLWAFASFRAQPGLLSLAALAYVFGLRHAVDPDHIAAIDNVVRKLMQDGRRPYAVGFFFSLGHSTVVILVAALVALAVNGFSDRIEWFKAVGGIVGTLASVFFLVLIAVMNCVILARLWRNFQAVQRGEPVTDEALNALLGGRGLLTRLLRPLFRLVSASPHMFVVGFLFGLGFDTATEISLLGMSATQAAGGMPLADIMVFPALFTAGMALVDTADSIMMVGAYGWAFVRPARKLWYNLTLTFVSVVVAVVIAGLEMLGLLADRLKLEGGVWTLVDSLNDRLSGLGFVIIGLFAVAWLAALLIFRWKRLDSLAETPLPQGAGD